MDKFRLFSYLSDTLVQDLTNYFGMKDHLSNVLNLIKLRKAGLKKIQAWKGLKLTTSAILVQRSNQLSYQANWELVICDFVIYSWMEKICDEYTKFKCRTTEYTF